MGKHYVNEIGTQILVDTNSNIKTATTVLLQVKKPSGKVINWTGTVSNTTIIKYTTKKGDLNEVGKYLLQAYVEMPGYSGRGDVTSFTIYNVFK